MQVMRPFFNSGGVFQSNYAVTDERKGKIILTTRTWIDIWQGCNVWHHECITIVEGPWIPRNLARPIQHFYQMARFLLVGTDGAVAW